MRYYYAQQMPRGFANEVRTYRFKSRSKRDNWVKEHENDGDVNSYSQGAHAISASTARRNVGYKGDACTESFNSGYIDL